MSILTSQFINISIPNCISELLKCQKIRLSRMHSKCKELGLSIKPYTAYTESELRVMTQMFLTDDSNQLIQMAIAKTGSTAWKNLFAGSHVDGPYHKNAHNFSMVEHDLGLLRLSNYSKPEILKRLKSFTLMVTVRHPFTRWESYFKDKCWKRKMSSMSEDDDILEVFLAALKNIRWKMENKKWDQHWDTFMHHASACIMPFK